MVRQSQVEKIKKAVSEVKEAKTSGDQPAVQRALSVWERAYQNATPEEVNAAIPF